MKKPDWHRQERAKVLSIRRRRWTWARRTAKRRVTRNTAAARARVQWVLTLEGNLDLIGNATEARRQLATFDAIRIPGPRSPKMKLYVNLAGLTRIDASAALYMVAQVDRLTQSRRIGIRGNFPRAEQPLQFLVDIGFHKIMRTQLGGVARRCTDPVVEITKGEAKRKLDPKNTWNKLHGFLKAQLDPEQADAVYNALGECVENVKQHAFPGDPGSWYALAIRPDRQSPARVIVLDIGQGIAATVRRPRHEVLISRILTGVINALKQVGVEAVSEDDARGFLARLRSDDWLCVYFATLGLRTQLPEKQRGTGLAGLRTSILELDTPGALHVLSGSAAVTWRRGQGDPQPRIFAALRGTLVCLEFDACDDDLRHDQATHRA